MGGHGDRRVRVVSLALFALVAAVFAPAIGNEFILLDDLTYIAENPHLRESFTAASRWALTEHYAANWHPLTWLSHLADVRFFGPDPRGHHAVNVALHAASAALLFVVLRALTGRLWTSALAAGLFALHPLRVESVAWAAARKDVLSGLLWVVALGAYLRHLRHPGPARYATVVAAFVLALSAKPSVVTLPFALLLLDFWPLGRLGPAGPPATTGRLGRLLLEKVPLFALAAAASVLTWRAQASWGAMEYLGDLSVADRVRNALTAYLVYVKQTVWPAGLAILYPHPRSGPGALRLAGVLAALGGVTLAAVSTGRRRPWLAAGWFWYLGTLVPMLGLVQVGVQASADRYTYLPSIGLAVIAAWGAAGLADRRPRRQTAMAATAVVALGALAVATRAQLVHWRDDVAVFGRAVAVTKGNWLAHMNLGAAHGNRGENRKAAEQFEAALRLRPDYPMAEENLRRAREALAEEGTSGRVRR